MYLFIDTETTGLTRLAFVTRRNFTQWPRLVQFAWAFGDADGLGEVHSALIRPDGFEIPLSSTRIHRVTQTFALERGEPVENVLQRFRAALSHAVVVVAHNLRFDVGVLHSEALRQNPPIRLSWPSVNICTMQQGQLFLASQFGQKHPGYPTLAHLYQTIFGFAFHPKHNAAADVRACAHVFFKMKSMGFIKAGPTPRKTSI